jgi:hypothetical protein
VVYWCTESLSDPITYIFEPSSLNVKPQGVVSCVATLNVASLVRLVV